MQNQLSGELIDRKLDRITNQKSVSASAFKSDSIESIPNSGQGMDRVAKKKPNYSRVVSFVCALVLISVFLWWLIETIAGGRSLRVNEDHVAIGAAVLGTYEDFIPLRGRIVPRSTVYLDAIEGGRVEEVLVEDGVIMRAGDPIALLSNTSLQLDVLSREAAVAEQLNTMRSLELQLEQNRLTHKSNLVDIDYRILTLNSELERKQDLADRDLISKSEMDDLESELAYLQQRREITLESQQTDGLLQKQQLSQLRETGKRLQANLGIAQKTLEDLSIAAPMSGKLSGFDIEVGQSIGRGERLGQIDDPTGFKLNVEIDEYYLGRVDLGQTAIGEYNNRNYQLTVSKIYPQVSDGFFYVDMIFELDAENLHRGQTLQLKLQLGGNTDAVLIPNGAFYEETGGSWLFVLSPDLSVALKRPVQMGRRNTEFIEIIEGLEPGEKVIISPYTSYIGMDELKIN